MAKQPDPEETFVQLVVTHQAALRAFVLSLLPGSSEVDDVIQETNSEIWQKRGEFRIGTNFKSWMFSVAKFKVLSSWRDQSRRKEWAMPEETLTKLIDRVETGNLGSTEVRLEALRACLQQLRPVDRGLILRRYIGEHSLGKLAAEVGRNAESLKVSLHRIRMALRTCVTHKTRMEELNP
ncbi:sigma-70 family RNA polymerase sigma factor [Akkermansiaceae bacterium]|nr:sigma-70 family RNA polymerase sigma factor [Akkermansiaceae bacterium]